MKRFLATAAAFSMLGAVGVVGAQTAYAGPGDGTITVHVVEDKDGDKVRTNADSNLQGVTVTLTNAAGEEHTGVTGTNGQLRMTAAQNPLTGGVYRVEVTNPDPDRFTEAQVGSNYVDPQLAPAVSFIDVTAGKAANISVGFVDLAGPIDLNPTLFSAIHPDNIWAVTEDEPEIYKISANLQESKPTQVTARGTVGTVYGMGVDPVTRDLFAGAFAKRGSDYGPGGPGAVYRVNPDTGASSVYVTVPDVGTTAHNFADKQDFAFRTAVGRESLGDVDVSPDGKWLSVMNLKTDSIVVYPVQSAPNPAPIQTLAITPQDCSTDWAPFAIEQSGDTVYVGATCGETIKAYVLEYERAVDGTLTFIDVVMESDLTTIPGRNLQQVFSGSLTCFTAKWNAWSDDIPQDCIDGATPYPLGPPNPKSFDTFAWQFAFAQPQLADIEVMNDGKLAVSFRDRSGDQYSSILYVGERSTGGDAYHTNIPAGDLLFACGDGANGFVLNCGATTENVKEDVVLFHLEAAFGGIAYMPATDHIITNQIDPDGTVNRIGLRGYQSNGVVYNDASDWGDGVILTSGFKKAAGLADIEVLLKALTQQVGNRVWIDTDKDGIQGPDEPAVPGVQVSLYNEEGVVIATTETDANGEYYFDTDDGLAPETNYEIRLDRPADFEAGGPLEGMSVTQTSAAGSEAIDNNGVLSSGVVVAAFTSPVQGTNDHSIDFGFIETTLVSVGDYVWIDANDNGVQDAGEVPVAGVTVNLLSADGETVVATTTTDADGYYVFTDLPVDTDYVVEFPTTVTVDGVEYVLTEPNRGGDDAADSDADVSTGRVSITTPSSGENLDGPGEADDPTIDAGYVPVPPVLVSVGDYVWIDANDDGVQDAGEVPVAGVTVNLLSADGETVVATTTTDADGYYVFTDLPVDTDYVVEFPTTVTVDGDEYVLTGPNRGGDDAADSNADVSTGRVSITTPSSGENLDGPGEADDPTIDAGYVPVVVPPVLVSIGDLVWIDEDGNGIQDEGEPGVPGVTVILETPDGQEVATTETDEDGFYVFPDLDPETEYVVKFPPTVTVDGVEYELTPPSQGDDVAKDSNPDPETGKTPVVTTPSSGENSDGPGEADDPTIDAGYVPVPPVLVSVGDYVWIDANDDGVQDAGEVPVAGVTVNLLSADGETVVATTTTDADGYYVFTDLPVDTDYVVEFPTTVTVDGDEYVLTGPNRGGNDSNDSDADVATGQVAVMTPTGHRDGTPGNSGLPGQADDPTIDAGYVPVPVPPVLVSIGDYVWIDANDNGIQDEGEAPVADVTVRLLDADGQTIRTTTTDPNGFYSFTDLDLDTDYVVVFPPSVSVEGQEYLLTQPGQGGNSANDSNPNTISGQAPVTTPTSGNNSGAPGETDDPTIDAGYVPVPAPPVLVSVGDYVWIDANDNGIQDEGEAPVAGATVTLYAADGETVIAVTQTDADGYYAFTDLPVETEFIIEFPVTVTVEGKVYPLTEPNRGGDDAGDSDANVSTGRVSITTPSSGNNSGAPGEADDPTIDAGYVPVLVSIGDLVWIDEDGNGIQDEGEPGVPGVTVILETPDGQEVATTETDEDGFYVFPDLDPETEYVVKFPPTVTVDDVEYELTPPSQGDDRTKDSNPDPDTGKTPLITTPSEGNNSTEPGTADLPTIDAGYKPVPVPEPVVVSIGDYVWVDKDGDGKQDPNEPGIPGVTVKLLTPEGKEIKRTVTDKDGFYSFTDLTPGTDFIIEFPTTVMIQDVEYVLTTPDQGNDDGKDSDADTKTGRVSVTTPEDGLNLSEPGKTDNPTFDAGFVPVEEAPTLVSVGDFVWVDKDGDGKQNPNEPGIPGVTVRLLSPEGKEIKTAVTDKDGFYSFTDLTPDTEYIIEFPTTVTVDGKQHKLTVSGKGGNPALDSDADSKSGRVLIKTPKTGTNSGAPGEADDPTIDAGFVIVSSGDLPTTGGESPWPVLIGAMLIVGAGALLMRARSRKTL
ncbi:SdrD B-like domain-containing protein [Jonesiaceae bacterium BS-20]|uniref:SdrD B-like domain-containing protein n=1 Tax=Jonesiaceae bacterium BS-20 TaxID=3120821 RepID=A0AAU7DTN2_9MICO